METQVIEKTAPPKVTQAQAVAKATAGLPATDAVSDSAMIMATIERIAQNPNANSDAVKVLFEIWKQERDRAAEIAFNKDFSAMSKIMPRIQKDGTVSYDKVKGQPEKGQVEAFKFALYEDIDKVVRPILEEHGFSLSFTTSERAGGGLTVNGILAHKEGHSRTTSLPLALDTSGGKNNLQAMGSSSSYGRRYAACILLNIITVDEDDNGKADGMARTEAQIVGDMCNIHPDPKDIAADFPQALFKTTDERKAFMIEMKEKLSKAETEDEIDSLLDEHGSKFKHLGHNQQKAMNALFVEAKEQFGQTPLAG